MINYCLSKVASKLSALDYPAFTAIKDSSALLFVRNILRGLSRATEPLLRAINGQWKDEMTPENLKEGFVAVLKRVKEDALEKNDINITFAILSVPDFFNETVNQILQEACLNLGIETIKPFSRTMIGAWGGGTPRDARVLVIDQGQFHLRIRTYQEVRHYKKPLLQNYLPLDPFGSQAIDNQLLHQVLRTNKVLREQISLGANRQQLQLELARARLLIKDNIVILMGRSSEDHHHHEEWPLDLKDWWIGEKENAVLLWKDVEAVEDAYVESLGENILKFLVALRMRRERSTDQHIPPEDIDVAVIMTTHGDGELLKRAVSKALGRQVEIKGGALHDMMLAANGAALVAWTRLESWQEIQRYKQHKYGKDEGKLEHDEL